MSKYFHISISMMRMIDLEIEKNWILASVLYHLHKLYEVDDIDAEEGKE